jgi:hypothetical protein
MPEDTRHNRVRLVHVVEDRESKVRTEVWESWTRDGRVSHSVTASGYRHGWDRGVLHSPEQMLAAFAGAEKAERWIAGRRQQLSRYTVDGRVIPDCSLYEAPRSVSASSPEKPHRGPDTDTGRGSEMNETYLEDRQGRPLTVRFDGRDHWVRVGRYAEGNRPALLLVPKASPEDSIVVTVNPERGQATRPGELLIKNYSENSGVLEALEAAGVVERTGGKVQAGYASLDVVRPLVGIPAAPIRQDRTGGARRTADPNDQKHEDHGRPQEQGKGIRPEPHPISQCVFAALRRGDAYLSRAECAQFGIATRAHYRALRWAVRLGGVTVEQLDRARGDDRAMQALVSPQNPHRGVRFETGYEGLRRQEERHEQDRGRQPRGR